MANKMGVLIVHGIGSQEADFANEMIEELQERISASGNAITEIAWQPVFWADILEHKEQSLWNQLARGNDLDFVKIRKFVLSVLADAVAYQRIPGNQENIYDQIHKRVHQKLLNLKDKLGGSKPLVILAHSLGGHIVSNYIWDRQHGYEQDIYGTSPLEKMETVAGLVTFGCNIPLFTLAYEPVEAIQFPPKNLSKFFPPSVSPQKLQTEVKWLNIYDPDDVLGYPLKPLSPSYKAAVTKDLEINAGGILTSWTPASHTYYWTDNDVTRPVAKLISGILKLL